MNKEYERILKEYNPNYPDFIKSLSLKESNEYYVENILWNYLEYISYEKLFNNVEFIPIKIIDKILKEYENDKFINIIINQFLYHTERVYVELDLDITAMKYNEERDRLLGIFKDRYLELLEEYKNRENCIPYKTFNKNPSKYFTESKLYLY